MCGSSVCPRLSTTTLCLTDHTPGYSSAAKYIAHLEGSHPRPFSVQHPQRDGGRDHGPPRRLMPAGVRPVWLAARTAKVDLILLLEVLLLIRTSSFCPGGRAAVGKVQRYHRRPARGRVKTQTAPLPVRSGIHRWPAGRFWPQGHPQRHQPLPRSSSTTQAAVQELCHRVLHLQRCASHLASRTGCERGSRRWRCRRCRFAGERPYRSPSGSPPPVSVHHRVCGCAAGGKSGKKVPLEWITRRAAGDRKPLRSMPVR